MGKRHGLTALAVENAKAPNGRKEISDSRGLYLVVQPSGAKSWCFRYRRKEDRKPRKLTFEGRLSLAEARARAAEARKLVERGADPAADKQGTVKAQREAAAEREADTVEIIVAQFIERHAKVKTRTWRYAELMFEREVFPLWRGRSVHDIHDRDVIKLIDGIAADRPIAANRAFAQIRKFFNWCVKRRVLKVSPCAGLEPPSPENQRERVLSDAEVRAFWNATGDDPLLRMLLLSGQRRGEVSGMRRSEISETDQTWTLPPARTKNKQTHIVPLSTQAWALVDSLPRVGEFVFPGDRLGYGRMKRRVDAKMPAGEPWVLHDVRRTVATNLQKLGVRLEVTEAILNHSSGSRSGIVGIYQRHDWADEKRDALQRWADYVDTLVTGKSGNVTKLRARG